MSVHEGGSSSGGGGGGDGASWRPADSPRVAALQGALATIGLRVGGEPRAKRSGGGKKWPDGVGPCAMCGYAGRNPPGESWAHGRALVSGMPLATPPAAGTTATTALFFLRERDSKRVRGG